MVKSLKPGKDAEMTLSSKIKWTQVEMTSPFISNRETTGSMMAISSTSKNKERALMFMELFNTDKYLNNLINFGVEGKHFVKKNANTIDYAPGVTAQNSGYKPGTPWMFGNQYINYFWVGENQKKWAAFKEFNGSSLAAKTLGFNFDNSPIKAEAAACQTVWQQAVNPLACGAADPATLPSVIEKFKAAGIDKIEAEVQKQLNAWRAGKK
jgi:putative aldouronate transport system substrate-binding protein